jgi:hypothetical protein
VRRTWMYAATTKDEGGVATNKERLVATPPRW